jgi:hypothetical protein
MRALDLAVAHLPVPDAVPVAGPGPLADAVLVTGAGATLFHLAECPIVRDRDARAMSSADAEARGLRPCGMCAAVAEPVAS